MNALLIYIYECKNNKTTVIKTKMDKEERMRHQH